MIITLNHYFIINQKLMISLKPRLLNTKNFDKSSRSLKTNIHKPSNIADCFSVVKHRSDDCLKSSFECLESSVQSHRRSAVSLESSIDCHRRSIKCHESSVNIVHRSFDALQSSIKVVLRSIVCHRRSIKVIQSSVTCHRRSADCNQSSVKVVLRSDKFDKRKSFLI